jgi:signal transduction histidine kinase
VTPLILRWFGPPELPHPDLRRRAHALWIVSWPFFAVVTIVLAIAVAVEPDTFLRRLITISAVGALVSFLHIINRSGRPVLASWVLVIGLSLIVTQRAWITGGIHAPVAVFYVLFIVMGGVLIGVRGGVATAAVCIAGAIVLAVGTAFQWLTPRPGAGSTLGGFVFVLLAIGLALVLVALVVFRPRRDELGVDAVRMLVHDMRSPMQVVLAHLEMLRDDIRGERVKDVESAIDGATTLHRMTTSLLDVSRFEAGQMPVQRAVTDLSALAQAVVESFHVLQPGRHIAVEPDGDSMCNCDPELTRRVLENLVGNAMKHTEIDERVRVVVSGVPDTVRIAVVDEGPGIPADARTRMFEPYSALGVRTAAGYESSGIGLTFCKLAVEAQGGSIRIEAGTPRGSVFIVELPR